MAQALGAGGNNFQGTNSFTITIAADNDAGTAALTTFNLIRGTGAGSEAALPAGITISGDFTNFAELNNAFRDTGINVTELVLETATTAHYEGTKKIQMYERQMNNVAGPITDIYLNKYKTDSGGGVSTTLSIPDRPFFITPRTVMSVQIIKNASLTFTFMYNFAENKKPIAEG